MSDLGIMLWKELAETWANRRAVRIFAVSVLFLGLLPALTMNAHLPPQVATFIYLPYVLLTAMITAAQTGTDLVLRERTSHTLETLLASRLPDEAIFGGKVAAAVLTGLAAALVTMAVQIAALDTSGRASGLVYLATPVGRLLYLGAPLLLAAYLAPVAVFVALRVSDQRSAYMLTMASVTVLLLPFILHLVHLTFSLSWLGSAAAVLAVVDAVLIVAGGHFFRRERLILYLQD